MSVDFGRNPDFRILTASESTRTVELDGQSISNSLENKPNLPRGLRSDLLNSIIIERVI